MALKPPQNIFVSSRDLSDLSKTFGLSEYSEHSEHSTWSGTGTAVVLDSEPEPSKNADKALEEV